mmetsp:Transcript_29982/g.90754  ORF Transcript_29982/g.90754 Transcript_29982/m.90754 type:complete len:211 (-) Transcript_29982:398-1030(-)
MARPTCSCVTAAGWSSGRKAFAHPWPLAAKRACASWLSTSAIASGGTKGLGIALSAAKASTRRSAWLSHSTSAARAPAGGLAHGVGSVTTTAPPGRALTTGVAPRADSRCGCSVPARARATTRSTSGGWTSWAAPRAKRVLAIRAGRSLASARAYASRASWASAPCAEERAHLVTPARTPPPAAAHVALAQSGGPPRLAARSATSTCFLC